ncbi:nuclear transport factor 2 family protein [Rhodococcus sp. UNC363MFTsu5.1]|uniref:nuclear transport factor 2 family protein n=1 Tax=Rhodococcus sp. UNC363MFTsu5.1 TaxID=1449069 RepID=UPI0009DDC3B9|nr:nuclear transport factor 2 family protein [Rhodococcus sp. UNC363MFTsu5.1]
MTDQAGKGASTVRTDEPDPTFRSTPPADLGQLQDHLAVIDSLYRFQARLDAKDWPGLRSAMTEDARAYFVEGVDAVLTVVRAHLDVCGATQHLMGNVQVQLDGDTARTRSYFRAFHVGAGANEGAVYECLGDYTDSWARTDTGWALTSRVIAVRAETGDRAVITPR